MIKNPMVPDLELWIGTIERIKKAGNTKIMAVHRGFATYRNSLYRNEPLWRIPINLRRRFPHLPLICDASHTWAARQIMRVAQHAMDLHFDGLMIEFIAGDHCSMRRETAVDSNTV
jgi:chorismate mutase